MIDPIHLTKYVVRPVLKDLDLYSESAERLVLGTACVESECGRWLKQHGDGPALGIYQMEPATHQDLWDNFLRYRLDLALKITANGAEVPAETMVWDLRYACAMCRIHYYRVPEPIPDNLPGQAVYWRRYYNTSLGKGTEEGYIAAWRRFIPATLTLV